MKYFSLSETGPWQQVLDETLEDSRQESDPLPLQTFTFDPVIARFSKFKLLSYWGNGGGLQYFTIKQTGLRLDNKDILLSLERNADFVSFKSNDNGYLTVVGENEVAFKQSSVPEENQKFLLDEQCSSSINYPIILFGSFRSSSSGNLCLSDMVILSRALNLHFSGSGLSEVTLRSFIGLL